MLIYFFHTHTFFFLNSFGAPFNQQQICCRVSSAVRSSIICTCVIEWRGLRGEPAVRMQFSHPNWSWSFEVIKIRVWRQNNWYYATVIKPCWGFPFFPPFFPLTYNNNVCNVCFFCPPHKQPGCWLGTLLLSLSEVFFFFFPEVLRSPTHRHTL